MLSGWFIVLYILFGMAIVCNLGVMTLIWWHDLLKDETNYLIFFLHLTSCIQNIATLPFVYLGNDSICQMMAVFHYYGGLSNICVLVFLTLVYRNYIYNQLLRNEWIRKYSVYIIFIFPCIVLLPFSTNQYSVHSGAFCGLDVHDIQSEVWAFVIFYIWAIAALVICGIFFSYLFYYTVKYVPVEGRSLFYSVGIYIVVSWISLLPRCINRIVLLFGNLNFTDALEFVSNAPIPLAAIIYAITFYLNLRSYVNVSKHGSTKDSTSKTYGLEDFSFRWTLSDRGSKASNPSGVHRNSNLKEFITDELNGNQQSGRLSYFTTDNPLRFSAQQRNSSNEEL